MFLIEIIILLALFVAVAVAGAWLAGFDFVFGGFWARLFKNEEVQR